MSADPVVSPADTRAADYAVVMDYIQSLPVPGKVSEYRKRSDAIAALAALLAVGERDRRQIAQLTEPLTEIAVEVKLANDLSLEGQLAALWGVVRRHSTIARAAVLAGEEDARP